MTIRINKLPVILADKVQINDGKIIEVSRDPAFKYGWMSDRPLLTDCVRLYENVNIGFAGPGRDWYCDAYECVEYPFNEVPQGVSALWAINYVANRQKHQEE